MITYYVSADAVALGLTENEENSLDMLVEQCLKEHGIKPWGEMESEIFLFSGESLLIARPRAPRKQRLSTRVPRLRRM